MRNRMSCAVLVITTLGTGTAAAQGSAAWGATLGAGVTAAVGGRSDIMKTGLHAIGTVTRRAAGARTELGLEVGYQRLANKLVDDENHHVLTAMARMNYDVGTTSYLIGAAGIFRNEYTEPRVQPVLTNTKAAIGISGGAGLRFGQRFFGEARLIHAFTDGGSTTLLPVTIGARF